MEESYFQKYYQEVLERDDLIEKSKELPPLREASAAHTLGLTSGICAIVIDFFSPLGIVFGIIGIILSFFGYKHRKNLIGKAGMICSMAGILLGIISAIIYQCLDFLN